MNTHAVVKWCSSSTPIICNMVEISAITLSSGEDLEEGAIYTVKWKTRRYKAELIVLGK